MEPFVTLSAAAAATSGLKVGTGVCLIVQRDPIQTAKQVATLDQVSGGRFLFGIGGGWNAEEMADHGTDFKSRFEVMRERVEAMKVIWTKSKPEYAGQFVQLPPMMTWPKPVQKPHPPVIVGGAYPYGARRAIAYGDGWVPHARRPAYGDVLTSCRSSTSLPAGPDAIPTPFPSPSSAWPKTSISSSVTATLAWRASSSTCPPARPTRSCRCSTAACGSCARRAPERGERSR